MTPTLHHLHLMERYNVSTLTFMNHHVGYKIEHAKSTPFQNQRPKIMHNMSTTLPLCPGAGLKPI